MILFTSSYFPDEPAVGGLDRDSDRSDGLLGRLAGQVGNMVDCTKAGRCFS